MRDLTNCKECLHKDVCRMRNNYFNIINDAEKVEADDFFEITYRCKYFNKVEPIPRGHVI